VTAFLFQENMTDSSETTAEQKEWKVLPFKSISATIGKATRKTIELNLRNEDYFPPEGHSCLKLKTGACSMLLSSMI